MKIAVNTRFLLKNKLEGIGRFTFELLKVMVAEHPEDEFLFLFDRPFDESFVFANNIIPIVISPPARHPFLWYWWFEKAIPKVLEKYKPDVFLSPDGFCSLSSKVKTAMVIHDIGHYHFPEDTPFLVRHYYNHFVPKYLRKANRVITVSTFVKQEIMQTYGIEENKIAVACNAANKLFATFSEPAYQGYAGRSQKKKIKKKYAAEQEYFFYTGAIHPRKNVDQLIKAFDAFKTKTNAQDKLLLAGRLAWKTASVNAAHRQAKFKNDIIFLGFVEEQELVALMASAKCFVYISKHEGFGIPLLEAMQSEVPVICSDTTALAEVAGDAALLVSPNNTFAIAAAMEELWSDEILRKDLIQKGLIRNAIYTWDRAAEVVYNQLLNLTRQLA